jgi:hypothetical protein
MNNSEEQTLHEVNASTDTADMMGFAALLLLSSLYCLLLGAVAFHGRVYETAHWHIHIRHVV